MLRDGKLGNWKKEVSRVTIDPLNVVQYKSFSTARSEQRAEPDSVVTELGSKGKDVRGRVKKSEKRKGFAEVGVQDRLSEI